jgi:hypothetical protein
MRTKEIKHHGCGDHEFTDEEMDFLRAIENFKRESGIRFPTWTQALRLLKRLGYQRVTFKGGDVPELPECA